MFKKSFVLMIAMLVIFFLGAGNSFAVDIGNGIETGMSISEVSTKYEIEHFKTSRGLASYQKTGTGTFYFFNANTNNLIYKIVVLPNKSWDNVKYKLKNKCGSPFVRKDNKGNPVYFFRSADTGFKMVKNNWVDNAWQLWCGSISMWDNFARNHNMNKFPD